MADTITQAYRHIVMAQISEITEDKADRDPDMALMHEILNGIKVEVQTVIHDLIAEKRVIWRRTVNGEPMFKLNEKQNE